MHATADHGKLHGDAIRGTYDESRRVFEQLEALGVHYDDVVQVLEDEGVEKFAASWKELLDSISARWPRAEALHDRESAARSAGPAHPPARRPVRARAVRRHRRPGQQEAAAGDLRPGQPRAAAAGLLAGRLRPPGLGRRRLRADHARRGQGARAHAVPRGGLAAAGARASGSCRASSPTTQAFDHLARTVARAGRGARAPAATTRSTCRCRRTRSRSWCSSSSARACRSAPSAAEGRSPAVAPGRHREAVRPRPGERAGAQRDAGRGLPGARGVPHRPLPGQGDGAEPAGDALRQHAVRADLEPRLRRPRADHDGRGHRHRRPGRLLRRHRRGQGRDPESPAPAARADRDGGAALVRRRVAARGEGEGAGGRPDPGRHGGRDRARPVRGRLAGRRRRSAATWKRTASRPTRSPRPTRRSG